MPALAQDPLKSPACGQATQALEAARAQAGPQGQRSGRTEQLRREAARICLGAGPDASLQPPSRVARQPERVATPVFDPPRFPAPAANPQPPGPVQVPRPQALGHCDAGGCWDSNGTRLNRAGPALAGPGGVCAAQQGFVNCP